MNSCELSISRASRIISQIRRLLGPLLLLGICRLISFKFGRLVLFFQSAT